MNNPAHIAVSNQPDVRAEVLVAETGYEKLVNGEKFFFPNGGFKRAIRKDVETIHSQYQNKFKVEREIIEVNREGLYDSFPELLFHKSKKPKHFKTAEEFRDDHLFNEEIEANTRRFFWVFDHFLTEMKCLVYVHETGKSRRETKNTYNTLQKFWEIPSYFPKHTIVALCKLMPYAKEISMKINWLEQTFQLILGEKVTIEKKLKRFTYHNKKQKKTLGNVYLGNDSCLGSSLKVGKYTLAITIGPLDQKTIEKFTEGGERKKILNFLVTTFVPADLEVEYEYIPNPELKLNLNKNEKSILGLTSVL